MICRFAHGAGRLEKSPPPAWRCWFFSGAQAGVHKPATPCSSADECVERSCPQTSDCGPQVKTSLVALQQKFRRRFEGGEETPQLLPVQKIVRPPAAAHSRGGWGYPRSKKTRGSIQRLELREKFLAE